MLELRILTGLHRGAALPLEGDTIRIGSGSENDIVLLDPGMPAVASVIYRSDGGVWQYRSYRSTRHNGDTLDALDATGASNGTVLVAGARWFAGPVLIGCEEEGAPWPAEPVPCDASQRARPSKRSTSFATKISAALFIAIGLTALVAVLALAGRPSAPARSAAASASAVSALDAAGPPKQLVSAIVYPEQAVRRPPFGIRSASAGPYGFVVTDDDHVLIPGSRWHAFTLVRIEPRRAVFTGPHAAELTW